MRIFYSENSAYSGCYCLPEIQEEIYKYKDTRYLGYIEKKLLKSYIKENLYSPNNIFFSFYDIYQGVINDKFIITLTDTSMYEEIFGTTAVFFNSRNSGDYIDEYSEWSSKSCLYNYLAIINNEGETSNIKSFNKLISALYSVTKNKDYSFLELWQDRKSEFQNLKGKTLNFYNNRIDSSGQKSFINFADFITNKCTTLDYNYLETSVINFCPIKDKMYYGVSAMPNRINADSKKEEFYEINIIGVIDK